MSRELIGFIDDPALKLQNFPQRLRLCSTASIWSTQDPDPGHSKTRAGCEQDAGRLHFDFSDLPAIGWEAGPESKMICLTEGTLLGAVCLTVEETKKRTLNPI